MRTLFIGVPTKHSKKTINSISLYSAKLYRQLPTVSIFKVEIPKEELETFKTNLSAEVKFLLEAIYKENDCITLKSKSVEKYRFHSYDFTAVKDKITTIYIVEKDGIKK